MERVKRGFMVRGERKYLTLLRLGERVYILPPRAGAPANAAQRQHRKDFPDGLVIVTRRKESGNRIPQFYRSIYDAIRARIMMRVRYGATMASGEEQDVVEMVMQARRNIELILGRGAADELDRQMVQERLRELAANLERSRNFWKETAFEMIDAASDMYDAMGRINPSAKAAQLTAGRKRLQLRVMEIPLILSFVSRDELLLIEQRDFHLRLCSELLHRFKLILASSLFREADKHIGWYSPDFEPWAEQRANELRSLVVLPFTKTRYHALQDIAQAREAAGLRDWSAVKRVFQRIERSLELRLVQPRIEEALIKLDGMIYIRDENTEWSHAFVDDNCKKLGAFFFELGNYMLQNISDRGFRKPVVRELAAGLDGASKDIRLHKLVEAKTGLKRALSLI